MDVTTPHFGSVDLGGEMPEYGRDHDKIHQRQPKLPPGQDCALVSWIDNDPHTIQIHGCFADHEDAREFYTKMTEKMKNRGQAVLGMAGTVNLGYWVAWPPKLEYFKNTTEKGQGIVDRALHDHLERRKQVRQELIDRVEEQTKSTLSISSTE